MDGKDGFDDSNIRLQVEVDVLLASTPPPPPRPRCWPRWGAPLPALLTAASLALAATAVAAAQHCGRGLAAAGPGHLAGLAAAPPPLGSPRRGLWCNEKVPEAALRPPFAGMPSLWAAEEAGRAALVKVLSYNLYWWKLFRQEGGQSASDLIARAGAEVPFDIMAFQECEDLQLVLSRAGLADQYEQQEGEHNICLAHRRAGWSRLDHGQEDVAEDTPKYYYGRRAAQWVRLRHDASGKTVFFVNHHGPLEKNTGGVCGGGATSYNLLSLIATHGRPGDAVVIAGDFNANAASWTLEGLFTRLHRNMFGIRGGDDNILSNVRAVLSSRVNLGGGGSDHDAITVVLQVGSGPAVEAASAQVGAGGPATVGAAEPAQTAPPPTAWAVSPATAAGWVPGSPAPAQSQLQALLARAQGGLAGLGLPAR